VLSLDTKSHFLSMPKQKENRCCAARANVGLQVLCIIEPASSCSGLSPFFLYFNVAAFIAVTVALQL